MKNFSAAQYQYDNTGDEDPERCELCGRKMKINFVGEKQCSDVVHCGWRKDDDD